MSPVNQGLLREKLEEHLPPVRRGATVQATATPVSRRSPSPAQSNARGPDTAPESEQAGGPGPPR